jgi:hypothetical protein
MPAKLAGILFTRRNETSEAWWIHIDAAIRAAIAA